MCGRTHAHAPGLVGVYRYRRTLRANEHRRPVPGARREPGIRFEWADKVYDGTRMMMDLPVFTLGMRIVGPIVQVLYRLDYPPMACDIIENCLVA
eukprot:scaffold5905_cov132-Isochrysis_galbana.AAC.8